MKLLCKKPANILYPEGTDHVLVSSVSSEPWTVVTPLIMFLLNIRQRLFNELTDWHQSDTYSRHRRHHWNCFVMGSEHTSQQFNFTKTLDWLREYRGQDRNRQWDCLIRLVFYPHDISKPSQSMVVWTLIYGIGVTFPGLMLELRLKKPCWIRIGPPMRLLNPMNALSTHYVFTTQEHCNTIFMSSIRVGIQQLHMAVLDGFDDAWKLRVRNENEIIS